MKENPRIKSIWVYKPTSCDHEQRARRDELLAMLAHVPGH